MYLGIAFPHYVDGMYLELLVLAGANAVSKHTGETNSRPIGQAVVRRTCQYASCQRGSWRHASLPTQRR